MTGAQSFVARIALAAAASAAMLGVVGVRRLYRGSAERFDRMLLLAFAASRLLLFALIFVALHIQVRGDLVAYYVPQAIARLHGAVPYRDFASSYAPLNSYLDAAIYSIRATPLSLVLLAIVAEILSVALWLRVARATFSDATIRFAALLYLFSPISLQFVTIDGQNNVLISLFLALALWLLLKRSSFAAGIAYGLSICVVKFLPLIWGPVFLLYAPRRWRWLAGGALTVGLVYGAFALGLHAPILSPLAGEGSIKGAGNIAFLVESIVGRDLGHRLWDGLLVFIMVAFCAREGMRRQRHAIAHTNTALVRTLILAMPYFLLALMALAKKSWPTYTVMVLFPLMLVVAGAARHASNLLQKAAVGLMLLFSLMSVTEHSYWTSFLAQPTALALHMGLLQGRRPFLLLLVLEALLLGSYLLLIWLNLQEQNAPETAPVPLEGKLHS